VRRQANWFKATDPRIHWYDARSVDPAALASDLQTYFDHNSPL
jgi:hypothetical protein